MSASAPLSDQECAALCDLAAWTDTLAWQGDPAQLLWDDPEMLSSLLPLGAVRDLIGVFF